MTVTIPVWIITALGAISLLSIIWLAALGLLFLWGMSGDKGFFKF